MDEVLVGGHLSGVVRRGDTVRRRTGPWTPAIHALLAHLRRNGFTACPEVLEIDGGVEVLRWIPGEVLTYPPADWFWDEDLAAGCGQLLRDLHDAMRDFVPPPARTWSPRWQTPGPHEVLCHGDFSPCNVLFVGGAPTAVIDFDFAGPGPRLWDVSSAAYRTAPLHAPRLWQEWGVPPPEIGTVRRRLHAFLDAYGETDVAGVLDLMAAQQERSIAIIDGLEPTSAQRVERHDQAYRADLAWLTEVRASLF